MSIFSSHRGSSTAYLGLNRVQRHAEKLKYVVLVATGHSGSTLLAMLLDSHSKIASVGECSVSPSTRRRMADPNSYKCSCGQLVRECTLWNQVFAEVHRAGLPLDEKNWINDLRYKSAVANRLLNTYRPDFPWAQLQAVADRGLPFHSSRRRRAVQASITLARAVLDVTGKDVFFDSCKSLRKHESLLQSSELDVRVIRLMRDVRGFVHSRQRHGIGAEVAAKQWRHYHYSGDSLLTAVPAERVCRITYEEMCSNPSATMATLHSFLGVPIEPVPDVLRPAEHHMIGNSLRKNEAISLSLVPWQDRITAEAANTAIRIAGESNRRYGYGEV